MVGVDRRRKDIIDTINANPTEITIRVIEKRVIDGESINVKKDMPAKVRIFHDNETVEQSISNPRAVFDVTKKYGMLVDYTVDLPTTSQSYIEFASVYGEFKSNGIYPQIIKGNICGYQVDIKRID